MTRPRQQPRLRVVCYSYSHLTIGSMGRVNHSLPISCVYLFRHSRKPWRQRNFPMGLRFHRQYDCYLLSVKLYLLSILFFDFEVVAKVQTSLSPLRKLYLGFQNSYHLRLSVKSSPIIISSPTLYVLFFPNSFILLFF